MKQTKNKKLLRSSWGMILGCDGNTEYIFKIQKRWPGYTKQLFHRMLPFYMKINFIAVSISKHRFYSDRVLSFFFFVTSDRNRKEETHRNTQRELQSWRNVQSMRQENLKHVSTKISYFNVDRMKIPSMNSDCTHSRCSQNEIFVVTEMRKSFSSLSISKIVYCFLEKHFKHFTARLFPLE